MKTTMTRAALALALGWGGVAAMGVDAMAETPEPTFEVDRKSRARGKIKTFFRHIEQAKRSARDPKGALDRASAALGEAASRDPSLDLTELRAYHAAVSTELLTAAADLEAARALERRHAQLVERIAGDILDTTWTGADDSARIDADVAAYRARVDEALGDEFDAVSPEAKARALERLAPSMDAWTSALPLDLAFADQTMKSVGIGQPVYDTLLTYDAYLYAARSFFPGEPRYAEAAAEVTRRMQALGSREGAAAAKSRVVEARAAEVTLPKASHEDPAVDALFREAFATGGFGEEPLVIRVTSDWRVERHPVSGVIVGRKRDAAIAARHAQGHCNLYDFTMIQEHDGNSYGAARRSSHTTRRIACKNIQ